MMTEYFFLLYLNMKKYIILFTILLFSCSNKPKEETLTIYTNNHIWKFKDLKGYNNDNDTLNFKSIKERNTFIEKETRLNVLNNKSK